jgi:hypothetical protein
MFKKILLVAFTIALSIVGYMKLVAAHTFYVKPACGFIEAGGASYDRGATMVLLINGVLADADVVPYGEGDTSLYVSSSPSATQNFTWQVIVNNRGTTWDKDVSGKQEGCTPTTTSSTTTTSTTTSTTLPPTTTSTSTTQPATTTSTTLTATTTSTQPTTTATVVDGSTTTTQAATTTSVAATSTTVAPGTTTSTLVATDAPATTGVPSTTAAPSTLAPVATISPSLPKTGRDWTKVSVIATMILLVGIFAVWIALRRPKTV